MSPYPIGIITLILSTTSITFSVYCQACAIGLLKIVTHVLVGASIESFTKKEATTGLEIGVLVFGLVLGITITVYVWIKINKVLKEVQSRDIGYLEIDVEETSDTPDSSESVMIV